MYNGIYFQSTLFRDGRLGTDSLGRVCPLHSSWGVMRGNVVHSNQRFGWYPDVNYPNAVQRSLDSNGYVTDLNAKCTDDLTDFTADAGERVCAHSDRQREGRVLQPCGSCAKAVTLLSAAQLALST